MKAIRLAASLAVVGAAAYLILGFCWRPLRANRMVEVLEKSTRSMYEQRAGMWQTMNARRNLGRTDIALRDDPYNMNLLMIKGANQMLLQQYWAARETYQEALRYDNRPEILIQLAIAEARANDIASARKHASAALQFNPKFLDSVEDPLLRTQLHDLVQEDYAARGNLVSNPMMREGRPLGTKRTHDRLGIGGPSAASRWWLVNGTKGTTTTERVELPGIAGPVLHVLAESGFGGVLQTWGALGSGPSHVKSSVKVLVKRGSVMVSTGRLGFGKLDTQSIPAGGWQTIQGTNADCPVNHVRVVSFDAGADFYIAEVSVTAQPGRPCDNILEP